VAALEPVREARQLEHIVRVLWIHEAIVLQQVVVAEWPVGPACGARLCQRSAV